MNILIFFFLFEIMQGIDVILTEIALKNPNIHEISPVYGTAPYFVAKFGMVVPICGMLAWVGSKDQKWMHIGMATMLVLYIFIIINNIYWIVTA